LNIIKLSNIHKAYGDKILLDGVSLHINEGEKIGLVGVNGTGKSTLLKLIVGEETCDQGEVIVVGNRSIEYLPQEPFYSRNATIIEQVLEGDQPEVALVREYEMLTLELSKGNFKVQERLSEVQSRIEIENMWAFASEVKTVLTKLKVTEFNKNMNELSGGERKRVALASSLLRKSDLLILDEPTNHMDNEMIVWLEEYLAARKGTLLMVTHDRFFLDRVTNHILELDNGELYKYGGNFTEFKEKKQIRQMNQLAELKKTEQLFKQEQEWMRKSPQARATKQKARIQRFDKLEEELNAKQESNESLELPTLSIRLGKSVLELKDIEKAYSDKFLITNLNYVVKKSDRIGIIGKNGSGKTTLLKMIAGDILPDKGEILRGQTVRIGFFSQENEDLDEGLRVIEYVRNIGDCIGTDYWQNVTPNKMLERFLFSTETQYTYISKLSGGEKRRLSLLGKLVQAPNMILLDEPTNNLDLMTLEVLETYLIDFPGPVVVVSHDRYFLDKICNVIFAFEENGHIDIHTGNFSDYSTYKQTRNEGLEKQFREKRKKGIPCSNELRNRRLTYLEKRELESIEGEIGELENTKDHIEESMGKMVDDYVALQEYYEKKEKIVKRIEEKLERWAYLSEILEKNGGD